MSAVAVSNETLIAFSGVEKAYAPDVAALTGLDLHVGRGEFVFVAGSSGAGKSTLLKLIFGAERPTTGQVLVDGCAIAQATRQEIAALRRSVGVIFQDYKLLETRTVLQNVAFALEVTGVERKASEEVSELMLRALGLQDSLHDYPAELSGGEKQRVAIARALVGRPKLILADEPTGNLDPDMTIAIFQLLLEANSCGATVIVASHDLALIEEINRRTLVLDAGRLIGDFDRTRG